MAEGRDEVILVAEGVTKRFGGLVAVNDVSFVVRRNTIQAIIGPNGSGKTTVFNLITGVFPVTAGSVTYKAEPITGLKSHEIARLGLVRTFQHAQLFVDMTVLQNVMVGFHRRTRCGAIDALLTSPAARREEEWVMAHAFDLLVSMGLGEMAKEMAGNLSHGQQRLVEICRAFASRPEVLLLDEPAAGLSSAETAELELRVRQIRDEGTTIVLVEHHMGLVMKLADEVLVLEYGRKISEGPPEKVQNDPRVIQAYLGGATK